MKKTMRKALIPSALAAVLLTTACTGGMTTPAAPLTNAPTSTTQSSTASPTKSAAATPSKFTTAPTTKAPSSSSAPVATTKAPVQTSNPSAPSSAAGVVAEAKKVIAIIPVKGRAPKTGYSRSEFGPAWSDVDHNGCDTRNDILKRDLTNETFKDGTKQCVVATGVLNDPYTGKTIQWKRGAKTSAAIQVDHLVALSNAFQTGAQQWTEDKRKQFANDPINLMAADGPANMQKGDKDAATWLPANKSFRCEYVSKQTLVKSKYGLWMTSGEKAAINGILEGC